jgi:hypothetical protein
MDETVRYDIPHVSEEENEILTALFGEEEVKMAVFDIEHNKAPGPDDFPSEFYQFFWEIVKLDLMNLFYEFYAGRLSIHSLNFGVITLLPKVDNAARIKQYKPICLLNMSFKIFTKVLNNRILKVVDKLIGPSQTTLSQVAISWRELLYYMKQFMNYIGKSRTECYLS